MAYLDELGLEAFWKKIKDWTRVHHGQSLKKGTATEAGIPLDLMNGADSPTALGDTVVITKSDITALGIPGSDTKYTDATQTAHGLMSAADKKKLDGVEANANHYVHPTSAAGAKASGLYKVATDAQGHVTGATAVTKSDISPLESDPTVPAWAKAATKPSYEAEEIDYAKGGKTVGSALESLEVGMTSANIAIAGKQDTIADLATIRSGAAKGATALQSVPSTYRTAAQQDAIHDRTKADLASPNFTGTPTAPTATVGTNSAQVATCAFVNTSLANALTGAAKYQGGMTAASYGKLTTYKAGWYWIVTEAGTIAGEACEVGDMVFCNTDSTTGAKSNAHFDIVQNNIEAIPLSVINALS